MKTPTVGARRIAVALDVPTVAQADRLAASLAGHVGMFKVGLELFCANGPAAVTRVQAHGPVFLDVKLHDIPTTVRRAARVLADLGVAYLTVHASGGAAMVEAAVEGLGDAGQVLAVTQLTSLSSLDRRTVGFADDMVVRLGRLAVDAGAAGLVCAPIDLPRLTAVVAGAVLVTPGVRPKGAARDDQARVATPGEAVRDGASLLVVGRPIVAADDPVAAADAIARTPVAAPVTPPTGPGTC